MEDWDGAEYKEARCVLWIKAFCHAIFMRTGWLKVIADSAGAKKAIHLELWDRWQCNKTWIWKLLSPLYCLALSSPSIFSAAFWPLATTEHNGGVLLFYGVCRGSQMNYRTLCCVSLIWRTCSTTNSFEFLCMNFPLNSRSVWSPSLTLLNTAAFERDFEPYNWHVLQISPQG